MDRETLADDEVDVLTALLASAIELGSLHIRQTRLTDSDYVDIARVLPMSLSSLVLEDSQLGDRAMVALAEVLPGCTRLRKAHFAGRGFGDTGVGALAKALGRCPALETLHVASTQVSWEEMCGFRIAYGRLLSRNE